ncbi:MAG: glycosyltransferase [Ornithinimicrobium sp.]
MSRSRRGGRQELRPHGSRTYVVVAENADLLEPLAGQLINLAKVSEAVCLVYGTGTCPDRLRPLTDNILLESSSGGGRHLLPTLRARRRPAAADHQLFTHARGNSRLRSVIAAADAITGVGETGVEVAKRLAQKAPAQFLDPDHLVHEITTGRLAHLTDPSSDIRQRLATKPRLRAFTRRVAALPRPLPVDLFPGLLALLRVLLPTNSFEAIGEAAAILEEVPGSALSPRDAVRRDATLALASLTATATLPLDHAHVVQRVLDAADRGLEQQNVEITTEFTHLAMQLLFHRELNADAMSSPLVDSPEEFLASWRTSAVGRRLQKSMPRLPRSVERESPTSPHSARVLVLPGSYPNFCVPIVHSLARDADPHVLDLTSGANYSGNGPRREIVEARVRHALGDGFEPHAELLAELEASDAAFVDWADRGAVMATMLVPEGVPLTVRIHSMDALSGWIHVIDWSRVDDLIFVSDHLRVVVHRLLGARLAHTRLHVIPNLIEPERVTVSRDGADSRTLLMIGWGQRVKDPLWALDVLGLLRREDPEWRLILAGRAFDTRQSVSTVRYSAEFDQRKAEDDVRGAVNLQDFTRDLRPCMRGCGHILSTSRRESFGVGLIEAAASGLVPVVRDWPIFAPLDAARGLFPTDWVVNSPEAAAQRILSTADEVTWARASASAMAAVRDRFDHVASAAAYNRVILGRLPT